MSTHVLSACLYVFVYLGVRVGAVMVLYIHVYICALDAILEKIEQIAEIRD